MLDRSPSPDDGPWACLKPNLKRRIWALRENQCRWPLWEELPERGDDRFYCGMPAARGAPQPYCERHCALAFRDWKR